MKTALVCGAGGFIGNAMVKRLKSEGYWVRGVDVKYPDFNKSEADDFVLADLRDPSRVERIIMITYQEPFVQPKCFDEVYQFACAMGGAGFIFTGENDAQIMRSVIINLNVLNCLHYLGFKGKVFYSSSACMYPQDAQELTTGCALSEDMAYPAHPDSEYGWEKLFSERLYLAYQRNYGLNVRIARFHNIYGPEGTYQGGKEKAPAAMCRKVAETWKKGYGKIDDLTEDYEEFEPIEVWGDGKQTRSFLYIEDCIDAVRLLMESDFKEPINIGSEEMVSINALAQMAIDISGKQIEIKNVPSNALGVRGRNSDNTLIRQVLGWEPKYTLRQGLEITYQWINQQINGK